MQFYIYCADVYCPECVRDIKKQINQNGTKNLCKEDSDNYPQGPFDNEESDSPQHCGSCGVFLEQPLTTHGYDYIRELILENPTLTSSKEWIDFYGSDIEPLEEEK
jgi:hypothetical protein